MLGRRQDHGRDDRFLDNPDPAGVRELGRTVDFAHLAVGRGDPVEDARRGRHEIHVELALEPLLDDLHVQKTQESAAKSEAERS